MSIIGVILAGGASSRMGADKALLEIEDQSMLDRARHLLSLTSVTKIVISRNDDTKKYIPDLIPKKGPLSGIHSVAMRFPTSDLLIIPVDLPLLDAPTLQVLIDLGSASGLNVRYDKHSLPLFLHNRAKLRQTLDYTLRCTNCYSVARFCSHFAMQETHAKKQSPLFNANTPEQWRFAMQHFQPSLKPLPNEKINESFQQRI